MPECELYIEAQLPRGWSQIISGHTEAPVLQKGQRTGPRPRSPVYQSWYNMIVRCHFRGAHTERSYLFLGVRVCTRWVAGDGTKCGFLCFLEDMGERPEGMSLDRIDPYGHYTPDNCRWADARTQANNKRKRKRA